MVPSFGASSLLLNWYELISQFLSPGCHQVCDFYPHCWLISPQKPMVAPPRKIADRKCRLRRWQSSTGPVVWVSRGRSQQWAASVSVLPAANPWGNPWGNHPLPRKIPWICRNFRWFLDDPPMVPWSGLLMICFSLQIFFNIYRSPPQHLWQVNIYR